VAVHCADQLYDEGDLGRNDEGDLGRNDEGDLGRMVSAVDFCLYREARSGHVRGHTRGRPRQQQRAAGGRGAPQYRVRLDFGDIDEAVAPARQAQDAARRSGDRDTEATATADLGMAYHARGDEASALAQLDAAIAIRRAPQDRRGEAIER
jgi:hypothetical protein